MVAIMPITTSDLTSGSSSISTFEQDTCDSTCIYTVKQRNRSALSAYNIKGNQIHKFDQQVLFLSTSNSTSKQTVVS